MQKIIFGLSAFVAFIIGFCALQQPDQDCLEVRGAFDIGSGTTRLQIAEIDVCQRKLVSVIYKDSVKVRYRKDLAKTKSKNFSDRIVLEGLNAVKDLINNAGAPEDVVSYSGVATEAFRQAENGEAVLKQLAEKIGELTSKAVRLEIITQRREAEVGVIGAASLLGSFLSRTAVWDIGGGSMQLSVPDEGGEFMIYESKFGAQQMKESIIRQVKRTNESTPNPISQDQYLTSKGLAIMAASDVPEDIRLRLLDSSLQVVGIGGVHYYSIRGQTRVEDKFSVRDVRQAIIKRLDLTDEELGGDYAETDLSNLIMVDGFMEHLNIKEVYPLDVNMTDGVLVESAFWE